MSSRHLRPGPIAVLLLVAATLAAYAQVGRFDFITHDDDDYVTANTVVKQGLTAEGLAWAFTTFAATNWHPLTWLSHMADVELFGLDAGGHHFVSLLLHVANVLLFYLLLRRLACGVWSAAFAAGLFALHPIQVESVAWIAERKNVLCTLFWLAAILAHVSWARAGGVARYLLVVGLAALGLLSKPMVVTLPFVLLLLDAWPLGRLGARAVLEKIPLLVLSSASAWLTVKAQASGGAVQELGALGLPARVANAVVSCARYLGKLVWPADLALEYPHPGLVSGGIGWSAATVVLCTALLLVLSAASFLAARSARTRYVCIGWLWFLGALVPVIGLVQVGSQALADRYVYIPGLGLFLIAAFGVADLVGRVRFDRRLVGMGGVAILGACLFLTLRQAALWRDSETIYQHSLSRTGESWKILYELALLRSAEGKLDEALSYFERAVRVNPTNCHLQRNLGVLLQQRGRLEEAISHFEQAVQASPGYVRGHFTLGLAYSAAGRPAEAIAELEATIRLDDGFAEAHFELGRLLSRSGRPRDALASLEHAASLPGGDEAIVLMALAAAYHANGRVGDAIAAAERAERRAIEKSQSVLARKIAVQIERYRGGG